MKSKPEYRHIFSSPRMFYRALHTISTQKYRLPVRRYIIDLFNIELDADVVRQLSDCAISLRAPQTAPEAIEPSPIQEQPQAQMPQPQPQPQPQPEPEPEQPPPLPPALPQPRPRQQRDTVQFRPRPVRHHVSESEEEESDVEEKEVAAKKPRAPVMSLRPKSRIIGFN